MKFLIQRRRYLSKSSQTYTLMPTVLLTIKEQRSLCLARECVKQPALLTVASNNLIVVFIIRMFRSLF